VTQQDFAMRHEQHPCRGGAIAKLYGMAFTEITGSVVFRYLHLFLWVTKHVQLFRIIILILYGKRYLTQASL